MAGESNGDSWTPPEVKFEKVGTFHTLPDGTIVPDTK